MEFRVWIDEEDEDDRGVTIPNAYDAEEAAELACEYWQSMGWWAGDEVPNSFTVWARPGRDDGKAQAIVITHDYSINWYGREVTK